MDRENILYALECIERAEETVSQLCNGERKWIMSDPAQPKSDPDLIISEALRVSDNIIREAFSALDTPATPPEDVAIRLCKEIFFDSPDVDLVHKRATMLVEYADSIRKQCADRVMDEKVDAEATRDPGDIAYNQAIDDAVAAIMRKE